MRVAVVYFSEKKNQALSGTAQALAKGIETQGHQVDIIDAIRKNDKKLLMYNYLAIGTEQVSTFGRISEKIGFYLNQAGSLGGRKSCAFVLKNTFGTTKALLNLMDAMEKEGMLIRNSLILHDKEEAFEAGKKLHI
jgi:menaquinone-dependent protoporphyrinogen IX oxidase